MEIADVLRLICALEALAIMPACIACMLGGPMRADQRFRFSALALIACVVVAGQIDAWGKPGNWRMPILAVALALALTGEVMFLLHRRRADRE